MEGINNWFSDLREEKPEWDNTIDKIVEGISESGFDSTNLNRSIDDELNRIKTEYESEFIQDLDNETEDGKN